MALAKASSNPLNPGFLKQQASPQETAWITYANNLPFPWIGDSAWAATMRATPTDWVSYVNDRAVKGFTVVHLALAPHWAWPGAITTAPFTVPSGCSTPAALATTKAPFSSVTAGGCVGADQESSNWLPCNSSRPQNPFWERFEQMVTCANDAGLVVFVTGIGQPAGVGESPASTLYPTLANAKKFARYLAGRLGGSHAILSPGFDDGGNSFSQARIQEIGAVLRSAAPRHILSNHFGTHSSGSQYYNIGATTNAAASVHAQSWLGFQMYQSGFANENLQKILYRPSALARALRGFTLSQFDSPIRKRAVNGEAVYDHGYNLTAPLPTGNGAVSAAPESWRYFSRSRARQTAWASLLSGANGYSLGVMGIWDWGICGNVNVTSNPIWCNQNLSDSCGGETATPYSGFRTSSLARSAPISGDMQRLASILFSGVDFANLNTTERNCDVGDLACINNNIAECVASGSGCNSTEERRMFLARDANTILAYLPDQTTASIQLRIEPSLGFRDSQGRVTGVFRRAYQGVPDVTLPVSPSAGNLYTFSRPATQPSEGEINDWVLVIRKPTGTALAGPGEGFQPLARLSDEVSPLGQIVVENLIDLASGSGSTQQIVGPQTDRRKQEPSLSVDTAGDALVAWIESAWTDLGVRSVISARRLMSGGTIGGAVLEVADFSGVAFDRLATAARPGGGFVLTWRGVRSDGATGVWVAFLDEKGAVVRPASELYRSGADRSTEHLRTACASSICTAIWSEIDRVSGQSRLLGSGIASDSVGPALVEEIQPWTYEALWPAEIRSVFGSLVLSWERLNAMGSYGIEAQVLSEAIQ